MRARAGWVVGLIAAAMLGGCNNGSSEAPRAADAGLRRDAGARRRLPELTVRFDGPPPDCFPVAFRTTRVRVRQGPVELCGLTRGNTPRCYLIDPVANTIRRVDVDDAPRTAPERVELVPPVQAVELSMQGARASLRGGNLAIRATTGSSRTVTAQQLGFHGLDGVVLAPVSEGAFLAAIATRSDDLGASAVADPNTLQMISHSANVPCQGSE